MSNEEILSLVNTYLDELYTNQDEQTQKTDEIYQLLKNEVEERKKKEEEAQKKAEEEAEKAEAEALEAEEAEALALAEEAEQYTIDEYIVDSKALQEQQIETLTQMQSTIENIEKIDMMTMAFLGLLIGVTLTQILSKYLKH